MNRIDSPLELQAYLDGELSPREGRRLADRLRAEPEAQALVAELTLARDLLRVYEETVTLPETRDFYWSKIEKAIAAQTAVASRVRRQPACWLRWIAPVMTAVALVAVLSLQSWKTARISQPPALVPSVGHEIDSATTDMSSFSFRSEAAGMTVVWVQHRWKP